MKKIISLFQRNYETDRLVRDEVVPGAEWVLNGEGTPTRKFDGTCCMVRDNKLYKRYDVKKKRKPPADFEPAQEPDKVTGHWPGWVPVKDGPEDKWHREGFENLCKIVDAPERDGIYELCGPKVQGNPEGFSKHVLISLLTEDRIDDFTDLVKPPQDFEGLKEYLSFYGFEGIVWHHPDGRMVKIKGKDFGIKRKAAK